jgi:indolepyruvate decarboxylase
VLNDPVIAFRQIDRTLNAAQYFSKPVYIEIPRDQVHAIGYPLPIENLAPYQSDPTALADAVAETLGLLANASSPTILAGVELHRQRLQNTLVALVERSHFPVAATLTGKSVMAERHPCYLGIYEGAMGSEYTRYMVEQSDLLLMLGVTLNDVDTGIYTARLDPQYMICAAQTEVTIRSHRYPRVALADFLTVLTRSIKQQSADVALIPQRAEMTDFPKPDTPMSINRLIARLNAALIPDMIVVADVGDCLFAAMDLQVHEQSEFLASAFYTSMGFAVPAALGAQIARPNHRALILVGDGAFQMTGTELSSHARYGLAPIVVVFNNAGYSTERGILEGPFNDISAWRFDRFSEVFGPLSGYDVLTEQDFETALMTALQDDKAPSLINVHLAVSDASSAMQRLSSHLKSRVVGTV